jgi:DNA polymerase I-like protein with 3'-5' exonuclease and polymerase domains
MEAAGFPADREGLKNFAAITDAESAAIRRELRDALGLETNFDAPGQLLEAFAKVGVELPDTAESTLKRTDHAAAKLLLRYRAFEMARRLTPLTDIRPDGRIYSEFLPLGAASGRFSSRDPNLQNVPRGTVRKYFGPTDPARRLVVADYSQIELRVASWIANDQKMKEAFARGEDLHRLTAAAILAKPVGQVTKEDRQLAKAVNFGLLYGQGAAGLVEYAATTYGVTLDLLTATSIRAKFFNHYSGLAAWHRSAWERAKATTEGRTETGRRLLIPETASDWTRFQARTNFPVQGSAADGLKYSMILLSDKLPAGACLIATVHDELICETDASQAEEVRQLTVNSMLQGMRTVFPDMPCIVEANVVSNWGEK